MKRTAWLKISRSVPNFTWRCAGIVSVSILPSAAAPARQLPGRRRSTGGGHIARPDALTAPFLLLSSMCGLVHHCVVAAQASATLRPPEEVWRIRGRVSRSCRARSGRTRAGRREAVISRYRRKAGGRLRGTPRSPEARRPAALPLLSCTSLRIP